MSGTSRVTGDGHARICERLGEQFPGATRSKAGQDRACSIEAKALLIHPSHQGAGGRHGTEDQCVTSGGLAGSRVAPGKRAYKRKRNGEQSPVSSRTASWYLKHSQKLCDREIGGGSGPEKGAGEGGWEEGGNQMSKGGDEVNPWSET